MRSRNGNRAFLLAVCTVTAFFPLCADDYIISYRAATQDALLLNEQLNVSRSMRPCSGTPLDPLVLYADEERPLKAILTEHSDSFFTFLQSLPLQLTHHEKTTDGQSRSVTVLSLPPRCFTVDFNDGFVKIAPLK